MEFRPTAIAGAFIVELQPQADERGSFARTFCTDEFARAGIDFDAVQVNLSLNTACHTLRGMHLQGEPHGEAKLVQCVRGRIFDVAIDLRRTSPSWMSVVSVELDADADRLFYIPPGCAHGFLTLEAHSDLLYYMGTRFVPGVGLGVRWDDPAFGIDWPAAPAVISDRDASYPDYQP
jgi:dTDP-4-dehydrorhamnose 3,5-epimerase